MDTNDEDEIVALKQYLERVESEIRRREAIVFEIKNSIENLQAQQGGRQPRRQTTITDGHRLVSKVAHRVSIQSFVQRKEVLLQRAKEDLSRAKERYQAVSQELNDLQMQIESGTFERK